ncbi:hypothetical protein [Burkholderia glumae]
MAATNDFLAFGGGASPNVIDQPTYAALPARQTGFQSGVAQSAQLNKVWRQSSIMAAVLAQFIVARTGQSATDDGTTATLLSNLLASAAGLNGDATQTFAVATATAANQAVPLSQTQAMLGNFSASYAYNANATLTKQIAGSVINWFGPSGGILTLPAAPLLSAGASVTFFNYGTGTVTIQTGGGSDFIYTGSSVTSITLNHGENLVLLFRGTTEIDVIGGTASLAFASGTRLGSSPALGDNSNAIASTAFVQQTLIAQASGVVGSARNLAMNVTAASTSGSMTADEIIVETALGGVRYCLANFSQPINLATVGAGGMDSGAAPTSGYVALYAIYNPSTGARALLARNATSAVAPSVYGGANMPAGYTASALVSVWPTDSSGRLVAAIQVDRSVSIANPIVLSTGSTASTPTSLSIASAVPPNARRVSGSVQATSSSASNLALIVYPTSVTGIGQQGLNTGVAAAAVVSVGFRDVAVSASQVIFYTATSSAGTPSFQIAICDYTI